MLAGAAVRAAPVGTAMANLGGLQRRENLDARAHLILGVDVTLVCPASASFGNLIRRGSPGLEAIFSSVIAAMAGCERQLLAKN